MDVCERVAATIRQHRLLRSGQKVVAAVSGGADSLCLLDCLYRLGYPLVLAHLNHKLRAGSEADAEFALHLAQRYGLPAVVASEDVRALARGRSIEDAARLARYRFLARVAREHRIRVIATGHTSDDQAETVLLHLIRGAGPTGLRGIQPATEMKDWAGIPEGSRLTLVRPLLDISRDETHAYCAERALAPRTDPTNRDPAFLRNRIRLELLPELASYNPGIRRALTRTAQVMREQADLMEGLVGSAWPEVVRPAGPVAVGISLEPFNRLPRAVQAELVRRALASLRPEARDFGMEDVERILNALTPGAGRRRASIGNGLEVERFGLEAILHAEGAAATFPQYPQMASPRPRHVRPPTTVRLAHGWRFVAQETRLTVRIRRELMGNTDPHVAAFDPEALAGPLTLRPPEPGDRLRPLGLKGSVKVAELLVDRHIPRPARALWPILVAGAAPVWAAGLRMDREARLTASSRRVIILRLTPPGRG